MPPRRRIFREAALQRFASPDQLDELMPLTDTNSWLGVLGFILLTALFLLWGVFGVVPTRVDGPGLLVVRGALTPVSARGAGAIAELRVQPGDTVEAGEVVALLELPGLEAEIALQQGRVDDRRRALEQILSAIDTERADRLRLQQAERGRLQQLRASAAARQSYFRMEVSRQEELLGEDLITRQQLEQTRLLLQGIEEDLAFSVGGGILADDDDAAGALADEAVQMAAARRVDCLELRSETAQFASWPTKSKTYAGHVGRIDPDPETRLAAIPRKKRADVRKGIKAGFTVDTDTTVDVFHDLYARNLHALGTPILPKKWYTALKDQFGDSCEISSVVVEGKPVVALLSFYFKDTIYPYYVGALPEARSLHAFDYVYWSLMQRAAERGFKRFDFGRSKIGTGAADYKKHWGFEGVPLEYQFHLIGDSQMPDVNPNNPKYARFVKAWKKLPFGVTKLVGPYLARQLG